MGTKKRLRVRVLGMVMWNQLSLFFFCFWLKAFRAESKQEKQLLQRLSHRHWKAISMRVGTGSGDTYGPMHYPGMRSLWQSPANFHQHLAFPSPPQPHHTLSPGPPTWFLSFLLHHLLFLEKPHLSHCPRMETFEQDGDRRMMAESLSCEVSLYCFQSWWS